MGIKGQGSKKDFLNGYCMVCSHIEYILSWIYNN